MLPTGKRVPAPGRLAYTVATVKAGLNEKSLFIIGACVLLLLSIVSPSLHAYTLDDSSDGAALGKHLHFLKDEQRELGLDQVRAAVASGAFRSSGKDDELNFSYSHAAYWLHTTLENRTNETAWLLELAFPQLDEVEFFLIDKASGATLYRYRTGDTLPFAERPVAHRHFVFPVTLAPTGSYELYLRIRSEGTLTAPLFLWKDSTFMNASRNDYMVSMFYFGLILAFFIYNLRLFFSLHDRVYLYYLGYMVSIVLAMGSWNGMFFEFLWPDTPQWGNRASIVGYNLTGLFGALFSRRFLDSRRHTPLLDRLMLACAWVFALLVAALPLGHFQLIAKVTSSLGIIFSLTAIVSGVYCLRQGKRSARYFLLAWGLLLLGTAVLGARSFGLMPTNILTLYSMQYASAFEIALFSFALAERIADLRRGKQIAEEAELAAKMKILELLEHTEHELERRVFERTQEITELNNRLREQEQRLKGLAMYDALTGLANRTLLDERIEEALSSSEVDSYKVALLLVDLDEFKPINDTHGHETGDAVLQAIATRLKGIVRSSDTVARLGGDEFVIVLPGLSDLDKALDIGEKVIHELSQPLRVGDLILTVGASVGISFYPDDGVDATTLLRRADKAMYEAKRKGRNRLFAATRMTSSEYARDKASEMEAEKNIEA